MKIELDQTLCTACHACVALCPKECISMQEDELGFLRPAIDTSRCISCGMCMKVCREAQEVSPCAEQKIYAAKHKNLSVKKRSASGGIFTALSDCVLRDSGIVVGARYMEDMYVQHDIAHTAQQRDAMRGSKYTYSLCNKQIFEQVKNELDTEKNVLFTGTPCQVAALKTFLRKPYCNLILVDILCHGVAAPVLYRDFINILQKKNGPISYVDFRYATDGNWHDPQTQIIYQNGIKKRGEIENSYFKMFVRNYCLRESCYNCRYAKFERASDITLGDFWGIEDKHPDFDAPHGVSVVVVNSEKGAVLFEKAKEYLDVLPCCESDCTHKQLNGLAPETRDVNFLNDYKANGYEFVYRKYVKHPLTIRIREQLYRFEVIRILRDAVKAIFGKT